MYLTKTIRSLFYKKHLDLVDAYRIVLCLEEPDPEPDLIQSRSIIKL